MASVNKVIIIGNLGKDPEVRYLPSGAAICNIAVATSRQWKDKTSGDKQEETEWHRITFFDRMAEIAGEYLKKGRSVYVEGRLKTRKYTDKDGVERQMTECKLIGMKMLGAKDDGDSAPRARDDAARARQQSPTPATPRGTVAAAKPATASAGGFEDMDDEIPF